MNRENAPFVGRLHDVEIALVVLELRQKRTRPRRWGFNMHQVLGSAVPGPPGQRLRCDAHDLLKGPIALKLREPVSLQDLTARGAVLIVEVLHEPRGIQRHGHKRRRAVRLCRVRQYGPWLRASMRAQRPLSYAG